MKTVEQIIKAMPPEDRKRLEKLAKASHQDIGDIVISILSKGASTSLAAILLSSSQGVLF